MLIYRVLGHKSVNPIIILKIILAIACFIKPRINVLGYWIELKLHYHNSSELVHTSIVNIAHSNLRDNKEK